ncbi:MAG: hypothetical protein AAGF47_01165 [Planctomycetota bacterium]
MAPAKMQESPTGIRSLPWRRIGSIALGVGGFAVVAAGLVAAESRAAAMVGTGTPQVRYQWAEARTGDQDGVWPPISAQIELLDEAHAAAARSGGAFSGRTLTAVAAVLEQSGWVDHVRRVIRSDDGSIDVSAKWRRPAAVVLQSGREFAVSRGVRRFPIEWPAGSSGLPAVIGARAATPGRDVVPGTVWPDFDVQAGVELINLLHDELGPDPVLGERGFDQIVAVDVGRYTTLRQLRIRTDTGSTIVWGRSPSDPVQDVVDTPTKLRRLANLRAHPDYGRRIDAGLDFIDLSAGPILVESQGRPGDDAR